MCDWFEARSQMWSFCWTHITLTGVSQNRTPCDFSTHNSYPTEIFNAKTLCIFAIIRLHDLQLLLNWVFEWCTVLSSTPLGKLVRKIKKNLILNGRALNRFFDHLPFTNFQAIFSSKTMALVSTPFINLNFQGILISNALAVHNLKK